MTTVLDQSPIAYGTDGTGELLIQSESIPGGTLYVSTVRWGESFGVAQSFVPAADGGLTRFLSLTNAKSDLGVPLTAAAGTPTGTVGVSRTAGTSLTLVGEATSSNAKTDKALFEFNLPDSYVAGSNLALTVNASVSGSGTLTGASTTMTVNAYSEANGVETALTVSAAEQMVAAGSNLVFTITGTGLVPGQHVAVELVMLVTSASGSNTGVINSVSYVA